MSPNRAAALVIAAGLAAELLIFVALTAAGANNEALAIATVICLMVTSFFAGDLGSREPRRDDHRDTPRNR
jgi:hypothetical protein